MQYLNEIEKAEVQKFIENNTLKEAVRKVLLEGVYFQGTLEEGKPADPLNNFILASFTNAKGAVPPALTMKPDKELGAELRSIINAISLIEKGFDKLETLREVKPEVKETKNKAR